MHSARMLRSVGKNNTDCPVLSCNLSIVSRPTREIGVDPIRRMSGSDPTALMHGGVRATPRVPRHENVGLGPRAWAGLSD